MVMFYMAWIVQDVQKTLPSGAQIKAADDYNLQIYKWTLWKTLHRVLLRSVIKNHAKLRSTLSMPFFISALQHLGSSGLSVRTNLCHYL